MVETENLETKGERETEGGVNISKLSICDEEEAREKASTAKSEGNALFSANDHENAIKKYTEALNYIKRISENENVCHNDDELNNKMLSVLYANRAAAYIGMKRWIPACRDGLLSAECDETNWKAYWRQARSLLSMIPKRFRTVKAIEALEKCLDCDTLPEKQKQNVRAELQNAKLKLDKQEEETPLPENCTIQ